MDFRSEFQAVIRAEEFRLGLCRVFARICESFRVRLRNTTKSFRLFGAWGGGGGDSPMPRKWTTAGRGCERVRVSRETKSEPRRTAVNIRGCKIEAINSPKTFSIASVLMGRGTRGLPCRSRVTSGRKAAANVGPRATRCSLHKRCAVVVVVKSGRLIPE